VHAEGDSELEANGVIVTYKLEPTDALNTDDALINVDGESV
jgi:hypothetical protein